MSTLDDVLHLPQLLIPGLMSPAPALPWTDEVRRARRGDRDAFAALVRGTQRSVYGLCARLLGRDAEASEATQETYLRAFQSLERFDDSRPFEIWVLAIARNLCVDLLRGRARAGLEDLAEHADALEASDVSAEQQAVARQESRALEAALATLSDDDRAVLSLYYAQHRTTKEIAAILSVAPGTVMARLFRAREKLRTRLSPAGGDPGGPPP